MGIYEYNLIYIYIYIYIRCFFTADTNSKGFPPAPLAVSVWPPPTSDGSGCEGADRERFAPGACNTWRIFRIETLIFSSRGAQKDGTLAHISVRVPSSPSFVTKCPLRLWTLGSRFHYDFGTGFRFVCTPRYIPRLRPMHPSMGVPLFC